MGVEPGYFVGYEFAGDEALVDRPAVKRKGLVGSLWKKNRGEEKQKHAMAGGPHWAPHDIPLTLKVRR